MKNRNPYSKQTAKLIAAIIQNIPEISSEIMQGWIQNPLGLEFILQGLNPVIRTEKSNDSEFWKSWSGRPFTSLHPELEKEFVDYYSLQDLEGIRFPSLSGKSLKDVYEHLLANDLLEQCLGISDGEGILKIKALTIKNFKCKHLILWRSVARSKDGRLMVPVLCPNDPDPVSYNPVLRLDKLFLDDETYYGDSTYRLTR